MAVYPRNVENSYKSPPHDGANGKTSGSPHKPSRQILWEPQTSEADFKPLVNSLLLRFLLFGSFTVISMKFISKRMLLIK